MDEFDVINDNEIRIVGNNPTPNEPKKGYRSKWKRFTIAMIILFVLLSIFVYFSNFNSQTNKIKRVLPTDTTIVEKSSYVEISDTIINNINLRCFIPYKAKPKLIVGLLSKIPPKYILGAMAADFGKYKDDYQVVGSFVEHGKMLSHSKSKYGFCAILADTIVIGNSLTTPFFEQAVEEEGDFFRQYALVENSKPLKNPPTHKDALRRSLCRLNNGKLCVIDTDMEVSLDSFAIALCGYGVSDAISLMGSGAAVRWAVDRAGRRFIAGADEYEFPNAVNYIVWE